jgi:hypothetical protein
LVELIALARLAEPGHQAGGGIGRLSRPVEEVDLLPSRDGADMGAAHVGSQAECGQDRGVLRLCIALGGDLCARRQGDEVEKIDDQPHLEVGHAGAAIAHQRDSGVLGKARLDVGRFGDAEIVVGGLQVAVAQKRNLHGRVG